MRTIEACSSLNGSISATLLSEGVALSSRVALVELLRPTMSRGSFHSRVGAMARRPSLVREIRTHIRTVDVVEALWLVDPVQLLLRPF